MLAVMTPTTEHRDAEKRFLAVLDGAGLPLPDETAYFRRAIVFLFNPSRTLILVDLDEFEDDAAAWTSEELDDLGELIAGREPPGPGYLEAA